MKWNKLLGPERIRSVKQKAGSGDLRTEFEKDYHRIIGSASFRRLQDKTQVFPLDKSDFIRTRLTHSLEVSSFAKSLGQNVSQKILKEIKDPDFLPSYQADVCDILQCAGLLHDIGNPPFGHFGETVIREWFAQHMDTLKGKGKPLSQILTEQMQQDFYHFEGNTQALRLVSKLHYLVDEHGMNLTIPLLGTIIKYPVSSLEINKKSGDIHTKKMGYFYAERDTFEKIQETLGTEGRRHPLAFLLEAADDIAYKTADVEDAFKKGCITYEQLLEELYQGIGMTAVEAREYMAKLSSGRVGEHAAGQNAGKTGEHAAGQTVGETGEHTAGKVEEYVAGQADQTVGENGEGNHETGEEIAEKMEYLKLVQLLERRYKQAQDRGMSKPAMNAVQNWAVTVQGRLLGCATDNFVKRYREIMGGTYKKELLSEGYGARMADVLGDIAYRYAFITAPISKLEIAAETILSFLLERFVKAAINYDTDVSLTEVQKKLMSLVSDNYKAIYRIFSEGKSEEERLYLRLLLITDYICGMTDSHAKQLYQEFSGIV